MRWAERSQGGLPAAAGPRALRHRPGRHISRAAPAIGRTADARSASTAMPSAGSAVGEGQDTMFAVLDATVPALAGRRAALSDGRRQARRHHRRGAARHRHVRLRAADALRPHRPGLHAARHGQSPQRAPSPTIRARSTRTAPCAACRHTAAPISIISCAPTRFWRAMLLTEHNLRYYQDLMAGLRAAIERGAVDDLAGALRRPACRGRHSAALRGDMARPLRLTQLGAKSAPPASPDDAVLEHVANPQHRRALSRALHRARNSPRSARSPASPISPISSSTMCPTSGSSRASR